MADAVSTDKHTTGHNLAIIIENVSTTVTKAEKLKVKQKDVLSLIWKAHSQIPKIAMNVSNSLMHVKLLKQMPQCLNTLPLITSVLLILLAKICVFIFVALRSDVKSQHYWWSFIPRRNQQWMEQYAAFDKISFTISCL